MQFLKTKLDGVRLIQLEPRVDERGSFMRVFDEVLYRAEGLESQFPQQNSSQNFRKGTLRGLHFQRPPHAEVKLVRCIDGSIFDVLVDLRKGSPTFGQWEGFELSEDNNTMLYVPHGFAHGYLTLTEKSAVSYGVSATYHPESEGGVRWNDPMFGIQWPIEPVSVSDKDSAWTDCTEAMAIDVG